MKDYFTINTDEMCVIASDGVVRVIDCAEKAKLEHDIADCRKSTTTARCRLAGIVDGPRIYLARGVNMDYDAFSDFTKHHKAPTGSCVEMTPGAYLTTEAWRKIVPNLCKGKGEILMLGPCNLPQRLKDQTSYFHRQQRNGKQKGLCRLVSDYFIGCSRHPYPFRIPSLFPGSQNLGYGRRE